jgi:hypothetical protein
MLIGPIRQHAHQPKSGPSLSGNTSTVTQAGSSRIVFLPRFRRPRLPNPHPASRLPDFPRRLAPRPSPLGSPRPSPSGGGRRWLPARAGRWTRAARPWPAALHGSQPGGRRQPRRCARRRSGAAPGRRPAGAKRGREVGGRAGAGGRSTQRCEALGAGQQATP